MRTLTILILAAGTALAQATPQPAPPAAYDRFVGLTAEIDKLVMQLAELRKRYTEAHPDVRELRGRLEGLRAQLSTERDAVPQQGVTSERARADRARLEADRARLQAEMARAQASAAASRRLPDNWWRNGGIVNTLRLTPDQIKRIEETFQRQRLRLIDLNAALEEEEVSLEPLVAADTLDEAKLTAQIDRVAQARAELEKSRGRMLVGIRKVLEPEQWRKVSEMGFTVTSR